jgi:hypothetical protein
MCFFVSGEAPSRAAVGGQHVLISLNKTFRLRAPRVAIESNLGLGASSTCRNWAAGMRSPIRIDDAGAFDIPGGP